MPFALFITSGAQDTIDGLTAGSLADPKKLRKVNKTLALLEADPRHRSLASHRYAGLDAEFGQAIWESYVENHTPGAWRVWWFYGIEPQMISVVRIAAHPD